MAHPDMHPIAFTYPLVASMWVITLHSLFLYSDPPSPCHPPSDWLRLFSSQTFSPINTPTFSNPFFTPTHLWRWNRQRSEMSAYKIQTRGITQKKAYSIQNMAVFHGEQVLPSSHYNMARGGQGPPRAAELMMMIWHSAIYGHGCKFGQAIWKCIL